MSRLAAGGRIDRDKPLTFVLDGVAHVGFAGDTLASAMVANDLLTVGPSMYRGRPRGLMAADVTEPNALVQVEAPYVEPMLPATVVELVDGLVARTLSGVGRLPAEPDTATYDKSFVHTDVLVVGAGAAGLAAALAASAGGLRVLLLDAGPELGGDLLTTRLSLDHAPAADWVAAAEAELASRPEVRVLTRTSAVGHYDQNYVLAVERRTDHLAEAPAHLSRHRLWHVRARRVVLTPGAHERPLVFGANDLPGVMLASALRRYALRHAALATTGPVVLATTNGTAYGVARDLLDAGVQVRAIVDSRQDPPAAEALETAGVKVHRGSAVRRALGTDHVTGVEIQTLGNGGATTTLECSVLGVSGGWNPDLHLWSQSRGTARWDDEVAAFLPDTAAQAVACAGAANGAGRGGTAVDLAAALADGFRAGTEAAAYLGSAVPDGFALPEVTSPHPQRRQAPDRPVWLVPGHSAEPYEDDRFVDLQRDATVAHVERALGTGMHHPEHVKRYTTIGTGQDQGRTAGVATLGVMSALLGGTPGDRGTTTFRAPTVPVPFATMAGRDVGALADPVRTTPIHPWHVAAGARFENVGQWKRPWYYPQLEETMAEAVRRECAAARTGVAMMDATTLGKIEIVGADAPEFLNRVYTNAFAKLPVGSARYGLMCGADGMVIDDGVTLRLAEDRFLMTTTTGGAAAVLDWLEEWLQTEWPELDVTLTSVTEQWSTIAVVGPDSRTVVGRLAPGLDVSNEAFGFMTYRETVLAGGVPARICRISFSGELAYEINVAGWYGLAVWESVVGAGADLDITPYGTETMHVLRAEKGFPIVGQDTDGTVTPVDLGMSWIVSKKKDFIGKRSLRRPDTARPDRKHLVGLLPVDPTALLPEGAALVAGDTPVTPGAGPVPMLGHVTSSYRSAALDRTFALALVTGGRDRIGETVLAPLADPPIAAVVTAPIFYDPEGLRRDG